jgi:hypothetical protein
MKGLGSRKALTLGFVAFAAVLVMQSGAADEVRASFDRELSRGAENSRGSPVGGAGSADRTDSVPVVSGADLIGWCDEPVSPYCTGYLLAVADSLAHHRGICLPENVSVGDLGRVYLDWAEEHPVLLANRASVLLDLAYEDAWGCSPS